MKFKTTQKAVKSGYPFVIGVGYCTLQNLLCEEIETAFITRREGWAADVYDFGDAAIVTGYAPFGNIYPSFEVLRKYEKKAVQIRNYYNFDYRECKNRLLELIGEFLEEVTQ